MRILHIITRLDRGGSAEAVMQIGERLLRKGHEVKIITGLTEDPQEDLEGYTQRARVPIIVIPALRREVNPFLDLSALCRLYRLIKRENPEIVHTHTSKAGILGRWAAWLAGVKVIIHSTHGHVFYGYFGRLKTKMFLWMEKLTAGITHRITTLSNLEIDDYQRLGLAEREKFVAIPYGIDTSSLKFTQSREEVRRGLGLYPEDRVVGWVGRLVPVKDCGTFLQAASLIEKVPPTHPSPSRGEGEGGGIRFLVVGDGPERQKMEEMTKQLGIEVIFTGMRNDVYDIMSSIDLFVLSSLNEGLGRVLLEAMAAGRTIVATKVGGVPEVVEDDVTGILVSPSDPEGMASAIMEILAHPERMTIMGEQGRKKVERFDIKTATESIEILYQKGGSII
jgi:glycosyltransferase involved in cell wall biosynthesis